MGELKKLAPSGFCVQRDFNPFTTKPSVLAVYFSKYLFSCNLYTTLLKFYFVVCKLIQIHPVKLEQNYVNHQTRKYFYIYLYSEANISLQFFLFL